MRGESATLQRPDQKHVLSIGLSYRSNIVWQLLVFHNTQNSFIYSFHSLISRLLGDQIAITNGLKISSWVGKPNVGPVG